MSMNIDEFKNDYDWQEAFCFVGNIRTAHNCASFGFGLECVAEVIAADEGQNDGDSWVMVGRLTDGRFFFLSAWCDYTGWDCQSGGDVQVADTLENLIRWCLGDKDRERLALPLPTTAAGGE
jgi:hypothetical protein